MSKLPLKEAARIFRRPLFRFTGQHMATYAELYDLQANSALANKIAVALLIAAETVRNEVPGNFPNHANRLLWAKQVALDPQKYIRPFLNAALAQNASLTTGQITSATDSALQTAVNAVIDIFATGAA